MDRDELRAVQRPIKDRYEREPDAALTERYCVVYQTLAGGVPVTIQRR